ncbi:hypothetical protein Dimus_014936 [Dionaea muscipula]
MSSLWSNPDAHSRRRSCGLDVTAVGLLFDGRPASQSIRAILLNKLIVNSSSRSTIVDFHFQRAVLVAAFYASALLSPSAMCSVRFHPGSDYHHRLLYTKSGNYSSTFVYMDW